MAEHALMLIEDGDAPATPVLALERGHLGGWLDAQAPMTRAWLKAVGFTAEAGSVCLVPAAEGTLAMVLLGVGQPDEPWDWAALPGKLPAGRYRLADGIAAPSATAAALGWALASYRFDRYRPAATTEDPPLLTWPRACDRAAVERAARATFLVRDLINTPAEDLGPAELAATVIGVGERFGATTSQIVGDELLRHDYPAVHAIGRASARPPRLIDLTWGDPAAPKVTLVGKGVCFDTGGLDLKPAAAMKLMKKDMGGAAIALGLASMIMAAGLPVRLRLLIPAVENSVSGEALRPLDVVRTRQGTTVEIGNTDAEGRVILADALSEACREQPRLLIDLATLTGAARVALGTEVPALFCDDDELAHAILAHGERAADPVWRLPLWAGYRRFLTRAKAAQLTNAPDHAFAGAILAALFLKEFVADGIPWAHLDLMAWNLDSRPGRPEGGEAMAMRALFATLAERFPG